MTAAAAPERLHGLDAVRGYALLLGVVFHGTLAYLPGASVWVVTDEARSPALSAVFFTSHMFRMTTFFLIAGFFARMMFHRRGAGGFIRDRLLRIGVPLVAGWPILITTIGLAAGYGVYVKTGVFPTRPPAGPPPPPSSWASTLPRWPSAARSWRSIPRVGCEAGSTAWSPPWPDRGWPPSRWRFR